MNSIELMDPAARGLAEAFAAFDPSVQPIGAYRASLEQAMAAIGPRTPVFREAWAPSSGGQPAVRLLVYQPARPTQQMPAVLFLHASGFIAGRPEWAATANQALADAQGALVVAVNYRLAPEAPFPAGLEDSYAALRWVHANAEQLAVDPSRIVVMGESAGGGLAAGLALLARDRGEFGLAGQALVYPMLDPRTGTDEAPAHNPNAGEFVWTSRHNRAAWAALRGDQPVDPERLGHFAPALAASLSGLPAAFVAVGALDLFAEEDVAYAMRLNRAGVPVALRLYPGGIHGFDATDSAIARQYKADLSAWLTQTLRQAVAERPGTAS